MSKPTLATVWLDGCSGCHMSFLDLDERLIDLKQVADLVYSPIVDAKEYPEDVDVCLVEGAVSSEDDLSKIQKVRARTKTLVSFGDCAVTSNVPGMRNPIGTGPILERGFLENVTINPGIPDRVVPKLLPRSSPVHEVVPVDVFLPGCPPSADIIFDTLLRLFDAGGPPEQPLRFG